MHISLFCDLGDCSLLSVTGWTTLPLGFTPLSITSQCEMSVLRCQAALGSWFWTSFYSFWLVQTCTAFHKARTFWGCGHHPAAHGPNLSNTMFFQLARKSVRQLTPARRFYSIRSLKIFGTTWCQPRPHAATMLVLQASLHLPQQHSEGWSVGYCEHK